MVLIDLSRDILETKVNFPSTSNDSYAMAIVDLIPSILEIALVHCLNSPNIYGEEYSKFLTR